MVDHPLTDPLQKPSDVMPQPLPLSQITRRRSQVALRLAAFTLLLGICFASPLSDLAYRARHSELYSHILLVPFISLYLIWLNKRNLALESEPFRPLAIFPLFLAIAALIGYWAALRLGWKLPTDD